MEHVRHRTHDHSVDIGLCRATVRAASTEKFRSSFSTLSLERCLKWSLATTPLPRCRRGNFVRCLIAVALYGKSIYEKCYVYVIFHISDQKKEHSSFRLYATKDKYGET